MVCDIRDKNAEVLREQGYVKSDRIGSSQMLNALRDWEEGSISTSTLKAAVSAWREDCRVPDPSTEEENSCGFSDSVYMRMRERGYVNDDDNVSISELRKSLIDARDGEIDRDFQREYVMTAWRQQCKIPDPQRNTREETA